MKKYPGLLLALVLFVLFMASCIQEPAKKAHGSKNVADTVNAGLDDLTRRISADSLDAQAFYLRSKYYVEHRDVNKALSDINKAIQLDSKNSDYFVTLSDIYLAMNRVPNCMDALKKAEELNPENNEAYLKLAEVYLLLKDYTNTFQYTDKAFKLDEHNPVAHFIRGYAYMEMGDTTSSLKQFEAAADQDQDYYEAYIELGILYSALKNPLAAGYLQTATRIEPNRPEAYYLLGLCYQDQENIQKAVETYEKLLTIAPDYKEALYNLGYINLVYINDFTKAAGYFTSAINLDPKYIDAIFNRGYSYELMGDAESARKDYMKALEIVPNYDRAIEGLNRLDK
jgi:tetratricopeptide (TPR) repeat protein